MSAVVVANAASDWHFRLSTATLYSNVSTLLLDAVPLATFSSQESAVIWISGGSSAHRDNDHNDPNSPMSSSGANHYTPVILSPVVLDQCKSLLVDSLVRRMFLSALNTTALQTDAAIKAMNDKDREMAQDLAGAAVGTLLLAASLATKEARNDRHGAAFWNSCKWARELTKRVAHLLSTTNDHGGGGTTATKSSSSKNWPCRASQPRAVVCSTRLVFHVAWRREMAQRWHQKNRPLVVHRSRRGPYTPQLFYALCGLFSVVLARWGGGGRDNIEGAKFSAQSEKAAKDEASDKPEAFTRALLNMLCFSRPCCQPRGPFCNRIPKWRRI